MLSAKRGEELGVDGCADPGDSERAILLSQETCPQESGRLAWTLAAAAIT
jgi:hypothetical protein